jgi:hypothetical protein
MAKISRKTVTLADKLAAHAANKAKAVAQFEATANALETSAQELEADALLAQEEANYLLSLANQAAAQAEANRAGAGKIRSLIQ